MLDRMNELPLPLKVLAWLVFAPNGFNIAVGILITKHIVPIVRQATFINSPIFLLGLKVGGAIGMAALIKRFIVKERLQRKVKPYY